MKTARTLMLCATIAWVGVWIAPATTGRLACLGLATAATVALTERVLRSLDRKTARKISGHNDRE